MFHALIRKCMQTAVYANVLTPKELVNFKLNSR